VTAERGTFGVLERCQVAENEITMRFSDCYQFPAFLLRALHKTLFWPA
jgi:hypothetical protein